jgi:general L-amino acid transport system permease protein
VTAAPIPVGGDRLPPPTEHAGVGAWLRHNLFSSWANTLITVVLGALIVLALLLAAQWAVGARWGVVTDNLRLFLIGQYPFDEAWRIWLALLLMSGLAGVSAAVYGGGAIRTLANWLAAGQALLGVLALVSNVPPVAGVALLFNAGLVWVAFVFALRRPAPRRYVTIAWLVLVVMSTVLLRGTGGPLPNVGTILWGGLLLTFVLAIIGIVLSFPFGVLLALGRRSNMRALSIISTTYIEVVRGVPLVSILFMASIMLPLFLPGEIRLDLALRAMGGITLFSAAYVAENVRGGLQAIPTGQLDAAHAIGLNTIQTNLYVVLPQALRSVIPANVGLFISLLKDTTLVYIVGLLELLGIGRAVLARPEWFGAQIEVYVFIAAVFFVLCYAMSQASYRLEAQMGVGKR